MPHATDRQRAYRLRRRHGLVLVVVAVSPAVIDAMRGLELLPVGEPDRAMLVEAVQRFVSCAPAIAAIPDRLYAR